MAGRKKRVTTRLAEIFGFDAAGERRKAGARKAARTKHSKAVHQRATALRHGQHDAYEAYQERRPLAKGAARQAKRDSGGSLYEAHKVFRRALANPELYMEAYGLTWSGRKRRSRKK